MITIHLRPYTVLREYLPDPASRQAIALEMEEGSTLGDAIGRLGIPEGKVMLAFVNGAQAGLEDVLHSGDRVELMPPVYGG